MNKLRDDTRCGAINLMLNISGYDDETLINLIPLLTEFRLKIPDLRLTFYNYDADYRFTPELISMLEKHGKYNLLTPTYSDGVKMLTAEIRRQHVILTEDNMMVLAAGAARIKTVILPDAGLHHKQSDGADYEGTRLISHKKKLFIRRLKSGLINALEEAAYEQ
ncbi:hypothetical protein JK231_24955 [Pantoea sp. JGM49]|uniref:hypothetical protein n=1 Tax=Pantoea sp. JGM49 TaxID=2799791 RepID=UPI001BAA04DB|nr:hypothetical protein [Pantoea sp. JGM49]MBS0883841.1 hypothetical protein [Pantoea sp. JGM49]